MSVWAWRIIGFLIGLMYGGAFASMFELIVIFVGIIGIVQLFMKKNQILTGPFGGVLIGLATGYFARGLFVKP
jgi:hypothetical protein